MKAFQTYLNERALKSKDMDTRNDYRDRLVKMIKAGDKIKLQAGGEGVLKFANDHNTGVYSSGADNIGLVTGGVARLTIDGSGSVTIPGNVIVSGTLTATNTNFSDQIALILALG